MPAERRHGSIADFTSYTEVSPSGTGVKIYFKADPLPALHGNKLSMDDVP